MQPRARVDRRHLHDLDEDLLGPPTENTTHAFSFATMVKSVAVADDLQIACHMSVGKYAYEKSAWMSALPLDFHNYVSQTANPSGSRPRNRFAKGRNA